MPAKLGLKSCQLPMILPLCIAVQRTKNAFKYVNALCRNITFGDTLIMDDGNGTLIDGTYR